MLSVAIAQYSSDDSIRIRYVLPVLWMTTCFCIMAPMGQNLPTWSCVELARCEVWWLWLPSRQHNSDRCYSE